MRNEKEKEREIENKRERDREGLKIEKGEMKRKTMLPATTKNKLPFEGSVIITGIIGA